MRHFKSLKFNGDYLDIWYVDDSTDPQVDAIAIKVKWVDDPKVVKFRKEFIRALANYYLSKNKNLDKLSNEEIKGLFKWLNDDPETC